MIDLLKKKKLKFNDENIAKVFLEKEVNYYKLNGYFHCFMKNDIFDENITFEIIREIFYFDMQLRNCLLFYTSYIETSFKNYVINIHTKNHQSTGYLHSDTVENANNHQKFIDIFNDSIKNNYKKDFVQHHMSKYGGVFPFWAAMEIISFGEISKFFKNMLKKDKIELAKKYYHLPHKYITNWIHCAVIIRNYSAHNSQLFNANIPEFVRLDPAENYTFKNNSIFAFALIILKLLPFDMYKNNFIESIKNLFKNFPNAYQYIDFPKNWEQILQNNIPQKIKALE